MSLFATDGMGFRRGVVLFMLALTMIVLYTNQVSLMYSYNKIADQRLLYTKETSVPQKGIIHGIMDSVAPYFQERENETDVLLEEEFAKFRKRDAELNIHSANHSFSSCLLIMDENHRLTEWLAYHIYALPLQHIVVANDPRSQTDPNIVFDKFRRLGLKIEVWNDTDFGFDRDWQSAEQNGDSNALTNIHRKRQVTFYKQCSNYLKTQNRSWTTFHDVDEYIVLDKHYINNTDTRLQQPGSILKWFQEARQTKPVDIDKQYWTKDCITLSRTMYGTHPSNTSEMEKDVPAFLNASKFETLAYRHHEPHHSGDVNGACKSLVDVQKVGAKTNYGVHVVMKGNDCGSMFVSSGPLAIHHYVGSWEFFSYKNDSRGTRRQSWEQKSSAGKVQNDDEIRPWIGGFVNHVGEHLAKYLLADVGYLAPLP